MRGKMEYDEGVVCDAPCCNIVVVADTDISSSSPHPPPPPPRASAGVRRPLRGVNYVRPCARLHAVFFIRDTVI